MRWEQSAPPTFLLLSAIICSLLAPTASAQDVPPQSNGIYYALQGPSDIRSDLDLYITLIIREDGSAFQQYTLFNRDSFDLSLASFGERTLHEDLSNNGTFTPGTWSYSKGTLRITLNQGVGKEILECTSKNTGLICESKSLIDGEFAPLEESPFKGNFLFARVGGGHKPLGSGTDQ